MGNIYKETLFMTFWRAVNADLRKRGAPELLFGAAWRLWAAVQSQALELSIIEAGRAA